MGVGKSKKYKSRGGGVGSIKKYHDKGANLNYVKKNANLKCFKNCPHRYCLEMFQILSTQILSSFWDMYENFEYIQKKTQM